MHQEGCAVQVTHATTTNTDAFSVSSLTNKDEATSGLLTGIVSCLYWMERLALLLKKLTSVMGKLSFVM